MGCNCGKRRQAAVRYELRLSGAARFGDGSQTKTYTTRAEAEAARASVGGGVIRPV